MAKKTAHRQTKSRDNRYCNYLDCAPAHSSIYEIRAPVLPKLLEVACLASIFIGLPLQHAHADVPKCMEAQSNVKEQLSPLVAGIIASNFPQYADKYSFDLSRFYSQEETDNARVCAATATITTKDGVQSRVEVTYNLVVTEDGEELIQLRGFDPKTLVYGLAAAEVGNAMRKGAISRQDFLAPQGPGSFADRMRQVDRERANEMSGNRQPGESPTK